MKISELIAWLEETKDKEGDLVVVVEHRDSGGSYNELSSKLNCVVDYDVYDDWTANLTIKKERVVIL